MIHGSFRRIRSLIADAIMAMANRRVNGSIGANLPAQACRSELPIFANSCDNSGDSFLDIMGAPWSPLVAAESQPTLRAPTAIKDKMVKNGFGDFGLDPAVAKPCQAHIKAPCRMGCSPNSHWAGGCRHCLPHTRSRLCRCRLPYGRSSPRHNSGRTNRAPLSFPHSNAFPYHRPPCTFECNR